jgi:hypothetical protein
LVTYVTDGIESAMTQAKAAAGARDVQVRGAYMRASTTFCARRSPTISASRPDALRPRLVAAAAMAALTSLEGSLDEKAAKQLPVAKKEALAVLDDAIVFLRGGIDALQAR